MAKIRSWEVSDEFWKRVEPFIPKRERESGKTFRRKPGGGRKPMSERRVFEGRAGRGNLDSRLSDDAALK